MGFLAGAVAPIVGGVAGAIFGGKGQKTTNTYTLPPEVQQAENAMLSKAQQVGGAPVSAYGGPLTAGMSPYMTDAAGLFGNASGLTKGALGILSGDPAAISAAMDPYQKDVIGGLNTQYDLERNATQQQLADQATRAGAFGGNRYGVALGQALADTNRAQAQQVGQLNYQGYNDVMNRAAQNLGFGMNAAGQLAGIGQYQTGLQAQNNQNLYNEWLRQQQMPYQQLQALQGATQAAGWLRNGTQTTSQPGSGILGGAIGGAMAGQGLFNMFKGGASPNVVAPTAANLMGNGAPMSWGTPGGIAFGQSPTYNQPTGTSYYGNP